MHLQNYNCATIQCPEEETLYHLFWTCPFARQCWDYICPNREVNLTMHEAFQDLKFKLNVPFFMEIIILASWAIWISRNNVIFNNQRASFNGWKAIYFQELNLVKHRIRKKYDQKFHDWLQNQA